jgi:hypothetical protein
MFMKRLPIACLVSAGFCWLTTGAYAENCSGLPTSFTGNQFPKGNFISNFNNNCYVIALSSGNGGTSEAGDLNSIYSKIFFNINSGNPGVAPMTLPPYEIIVLGQFPNTRYFSLGLYDNHSAITQNITDVNVVPLTSGDINPYEPGVAFVSGQRYGAAIHLGGTPGNVQTGCMMTGYNIETNALDGTQRHPYINWNFDAAFIKDGAGNGVHDVDTPEHTNPNQAGVLIIRSYLDLTAATSANQPHIIVRDVASGCAYPAAYIASLGNIVTSDSATGNVWLDQNQVQEHNVFANWQSGQCWGIVPPPYSEATLQFQRQNEYTPGANPDAAYLIANVASGLPQTLANAGEVMLIQFRVPTTPPTPCVNGCSRSGNEQMRYMSISFQTTGGGTLASLPDSCPANPIAPCTPLVQDPNGNVSLVVGTGVPQPSWVTAANGYTWLDLSKIANYTEFNEIAIRHILTSSWFDCSTQVVPYKVFEATTANGKLTGLMGLYSPWITEPVAGSQPCPPGVTTNCLPAIAVPIACPPGQLNCNACDVYPSGLPAIITPASQKCAVEPSNSIVINKVVTQCADLTQGGGCEYVVAQPSPPLNVVGQGFGYFPLGLPYTGNSNFLQITDITQTPSWSAGYTGAPCTVTIGEWSDGLISLIANVNQNGACPMAAGDTLNITVTNQQSLRSFLFPVTVYPQTAVTRKK